MAARPAKPALDVGIVTADGERALAFYRDALGFEPAGELRLPGVGLIRRLRWGESLLRILVPESPPHGEAGEGGLAGRPGYRYLTLEVENLADAVAACEKAGARVAIAPFALRPGRRVAQIADPDGNLIELGEDG